MSSTAGADVSRETSAQKRADEFFGARYALAARYVEVLRTDAVDHGLVGPREGARLWSRHVLNCAVLRDVIDPTQTVADVGSGAGLPGIPLAIAVPELRVTLIEPLERRAAFLSSTVELLGIAEQVTVIRARAEDCLELRETFDVVTARAVAPVSGLVGWTVPLAATGGRVVAMKGAKVRDELAAARRELRRYGVQEWHVHSLGKGIVDPTTTVVVFRVGSRPQPKPPKSNRRRS